MGVHISPLGSNNHSILVVILRVAHLLFINPGLSSIHHQSLLWWSRCLAQLYMPTPSAILSWNCKTWSESVLEVQNSTPLYNCNPTSADISIPIITKRLHQGSVGPICARSGVRQHNTLSVFLAVITRKILLLHGSNTHC